MTTVVTIPRILAFSTAVILAGCGKHAAEPSPSKSSAPAGQVAAKGVAPAAASDDAKHGTRKMKNVDVPVYVDGAEVAVLRYGELPSTVKAYADPSDPNHDARYYRLAEYLKALGADVDHVKSVHMLGNRDKVASIDGDELRGDKNRFVFDFMTGTSGIAKTRWDTTGLKNLYRIDEIRLISVYVAKPVPAIDKEQQCHLAADGQCQAGDVYAQAEIAKGTRVYVDGVLKGYVKRRQVQDKVIVGRTADDEEIYSLGRFLTQIGVDAGAAKNGVELVAGDDVFARVAGADWKSAADTLSFTLPKHAHGQTRMHVPAALQTKGEGGAVADRDVRITSVLLHKNTPASSRAVVAFDDLAEPGSDAQKLATADDGQREKFGSGQANE
jgi:hypothetical protein